MPMTRMWNKTTCKAAKKRRVVSAWRRGRIRSIVRRHGMACRLIVPPGRRSAFDKAKGFVGGAELGRVFVRDDRHGHVLEQIFEVPLVLEGLEETAVFHLVQNFDGNAACDVNAAER